MTNSKQVSRLTEALLETAADMNRSGILSSKAHEKITLRHLGRNEEPLHEEISPEGIRKLREDAHLSQAVFARYLNLTPGYVSQLERGTKRPTGSALALLNIIRRKGIEAIS
ncbi:MAG: helix-turn-helix domain-containing protein [Allorhizobium sp.]|uniref:Helix-turn-helix domain-containing protein n=1 Tax=Rhizobium rosettiformans TaxID=1368430 RepID=A0ABX7EXJ1_9HYPH|nr:helix-turn-helix domain-containing protein [Rhizobium rosettiformans]QRF52736.1 helix-turn-helix domain-containing protein [Rhizobium rosettiformans]